MNSTEKHWSYTIVQKMVENAIDWTFIDMNVFLWNYCEYLTNTWSKLWNKQQIVSKISCTFSKVYFLMLTSFPLHARFHNLKDMCKESSSIKWVKWECLKIAPGSVPFAQIFTFALGAAFNVSKIFYIRHNRKLVLLFFLFFFFFFLSEVFSGELLDFKKERFVYFFLLK